MEPWIKAWSDPVAGLRGTSANMCLADLRGDGEYNLVVADLAKRIRVYKGTQIAWESQLMDMPVAVEVFYSEQGKPAVPSLAVASGANLFIYKNAKPYFKFTLPNIDLSPDETSLWEALKTDSVSPIDALRTLSMLRERDIVLSTRSQELLSYDAPEAQVDFIQKNKEAPLLQSTFITCMTCVKKDQESDGSLSMLILGTEHRGIYILDHTGSAILKKVELPAVPSILSVSGLYSAEYRVLVVCRDAKVYMVKNGELMTSVIELETQACGLVRVDKHIFVGTIDQKIHCYHLKGRKMYSIYLPLPITNMQLLHMSITRNYKGLLVALADGSVRLYKDKNVVNTFATEEKIIGMTFGIYGREEGALVLNFKNGGLLVKMLHRRANLEAKGGLVGPPPEQDMPLNVPKKTKLYVEQAQREKDVASNMYTAFLKDMCSVRLRAAQSFLKTQNSGDVLTSSASNSNVRLNAFVQGIGPVFTLQLEVENLGKESIQGVLLTYIYSPALYKLTEPLVSFPVLLPAVKHCVQQEVTCVDRSGLADAIKVLLVAGDSALPLVSANLQMPATELSLFD